MGVARYEMLKQLIDGAYDGDVTALVVDVYQTYPIAINYIDRRVLSDYVDNLRGRPLTDEEWNQVKGELEDYDAHVDNSDIPNEFMDGILVDAGIDIDWRED